MPDMLQEMSGRLTLVTGAGQGIGAACVRALAESGAEVICTDLLTRSAAETADALRNAGFTARAEGLDVTDTAALEAVATRLPPLDILVCNAGIVSNTPAEEMEDAEWQRVLDVNLTGVFKTCRAFARPMLAHGRGSIVNIGSRLCENCGQRVPNPSPMCESCG